MKINMLFGAVAAATLLGGSAAVAQQEVNHRAATSPTGTVEITNTAGSVRVIGWNRNEVRVTGTLGRGTDRLQFGPEADRMVVRVVLPRRQSNVQGSDLEVRVPVGKTVNLRTVSAEATVQNVQGVVDVRTVSGEVEVSGRPREVMASSKSGSVEIDVASERVQAESVSGNVEVSGRVRDRVHVATVSGGVSISASTPEVRAKSVSGSVEIGAVGGMTTASTVSGSIDASGRRLQGSFETVSGDIEVTGSLDPRGTTRFSSHSGDIDLRIPSGTPAEIEVTTYSGEVETDLNSARVTRHSSREQRISVGRGGARVTIRTFSGDVKLHRR